MLQIQSWRLPSSILTGKHSADSKCVSQSLGQVKSSQSLNMGMMSFCNQEKKTDAIQQIYIEKLEVYSSLLCGCFCLT